jgi:UDP-2,3-diacylglucosamine hydrolase
LLQRIVGHPLTSITYRWLHPDLGVPLANAAAPFLGGGPASPAQRDRRAAEQQRWAEAAVRRDSSVDLLVRGHTHAPALVDVEPGRTYLNPGAWVEGLRYATVCGGAVRLLQHTG